MSAGFAEAARVLGVCAAALMPCALQAGSGVDPLYRLGPADIPCVIDAAMRQGVPANVLLAIASVEGGKNGQYVRNTNGSDDLGHFQVNTIHFSKGALFGQVRKEDAAWRGCYNAELAARLLRQKLDATGSQDYWVRVANYHSATPRFNAAYRARLVPLVVRWGRWLQIHYPTSVSHH